MQNETVYDENGRLRTRVLHKVCGKEVTTRDVSDGYDFACTNCDEDLFLSECDIEAIDYKDIKEFVVNNNITVKENKDNTLAGWYKNEKSALDFDSEKDCYIYCYDFIMNGFKPL